jgi:hypothetical protein
MEISGTLGQFGLQYVSARKLRDFSCLTIRSLVRITWVNLCDAWSFILGIHVREEVCRPVLLTAACWEGFPEILKLRVSF